MVVMAKIVITPIMNCDGITYTFPNFHGTTSEVWECISNVIHPTLYWAYDYLSRIGFKLIHVDKMGTWSHGKMVYYGRSVVKAIGVHEIKFAN